MRVLIISIIILAVLITGTVCNTIYMDNLTNKMLNIIANLPEQSNPNGDVSAIDELSYMWEKNSHFVAISAGSDYITDISAALTETREFYLSEYNAHYKCAHAKLYRAVCRLHELERFSLDNII